MKTGDGMYIMRHLWSLIIIELLKCLAISILATLLITLPVINYLGHLISNNFNDEKYLYINLILAIIFNSFCLYFIIFRSKIREIRNNILSIVEKKLERKIKINAEDVENWKKIVDEIKVHRFN